MIRQLARVLLVAVVVSFVAIPSIGPVHTAQAVTVEKLAFSAEEYSVIEGTGSGTTSLKLTVNRTGSTSGTVTVDVVITDGTAKKGEDFNEPTAGLTLTFRPGSKSATMSIPVIKDSVVEDAKTFTVALGEPEITGTTNDVELGEPAEATCTIWDDDGPGYFVFDPTEYKCYESDGKVTLTIARKNGAKGTAKVYWQASEGSAEWGSNKDWSGTKEGYVSFSSGTTSKTISFTIRNDTSEEPDEDFTVELTSAEGAALGGEGEILATVTIAASDSGTLAFSASEYSVDEDGDRVKITVKRSGIKDSAIGVRYRTKVGTGDNAATDGEDFEGVDPELEENYLYFDPNVTSQSFYIDIYDDDDAEGDETFTVELYEPIDGADLGSPSSATVTIKDDDTGVIQFSAASYSVNENAGTVSLTVNRSGGTSITAKVSYSTMDGTAKAGTDYTAVSGTLTFDKDETSQTITIPILDDTTYEQSEMFTVNLSSPTGATLGTRKTATVTIADNDPQQPATTVILTIGQTTATINGKTSTLESAPFINPVNGRTMVPLRLVAEAFGATVDWNGTTRTVTIKLGSTTIVMVVGATTVTVNGQSRPIDAPPQLLASGRVFVPIRFVSETLGGTVDYNSATQVITIKKQ